MTSSRSPSELLRDIHKKDTPYNLWILPGKVSLNLGELRTISCIVMIIH